MAGTALAYSGVDTPQGPVDIWVDIALPGAGATPLLAADGTPDATANPSCIHLGKLADGAKIGYKPKVTECMSDESTASYRRILEAEEVSISGSWKQLLNSQLLLRMTTGGSRTAASGYERVTIGGLVTSLPTYVIMAVWKQADVVNKWVTFTIYKAINDSGFDFQLTRKKDGESPFAMRGLTVDTRAAGDQIAAWNKQV